MAQEYEVSILTSGTISPDKEMPFGPDSRSLATNLISAKELEKNISQFCSTICGALDQIDDTGKYELGGMDLSVSLSGDGKLSIVSILSAEVKSETVIKLSFKKKA